VLRTRDVVAGLRGMHEGYLTQPVGGYLDQALRRAEWDLPFEHAELGWVLTLVACAGLVVGLAERRWHLPVAGWLLFGIATAFVLRPYVFRAFRNLLALVPLVCVLAALAWAAAAARLGRPRLAAVVAALVPLALFGPGLAGYVFAQLRHEDSRTLAVDWLAERVTKRDRVLVTEELYVLPSELARIRGRVEVLPQRALMRSLRDRRHRFVILGAVPRPVDGALVPTEAGRRRIQEDFRWIGTWGKLPAPPGTVFFIANDVRVDLLRLRGRPGPRPGGRLSSPPGDSAPSSQHADL
jgi:hypothetical protein